jgi:hypothetical protein
VDNRRKIEETNSRRRVPAGKQRRFFGNRRHTMERKEGNNDTRDTNEHQKKIKNRRST